MNNILDVILYARVYFEEALLLASAGVYPAVF